MDQGKSPSVDTPRSEDRRPSGGRQLSIEQLAEAAAIAEELDTRKKRLKVSRACVRCKQAKTCCDEQRPCRRCVRLGVEHDCVDAEQRKPGRKRKTDADDNSASNEPGSPPPPSPLATPQTPQFVQPLPKPPAPQSSASLPRIIDVDSALLFSGPPVSQSFDRKHPLYITPDTLPNPEKPFNAFVSSALSAAARAGEQFSQAVGGHSFQGASLAGVSGSPLFENPSIAMALLEAAKTRAAPSDARPGSSPHGTGSAAAHPTPSPMELLYSPAPPPSTPQSPAPAADGNPVARLLHPNTVMQSAYLALFECLQSLRRQAEEHQVPMHEPLYRFLCLHLLNKGPAYGIPLDVLEQHRHALGVNVTERVRLVPNSDWLRAMTQTCARAPIGIMGVQFTNLCIDSIFVNDEAARLFGYTPAEIKRLLLDPCENFLLRVWHFSDWRRMFTMMFMALVQQKEQVTTRGKFFHSSGVRFDAVWSFQLTFGPDGMPTSEVMYVTPVGETPLLRTQM